MFEECRETISRDFQSKFKGALKILSKDLRISSIININSIAWIEDSREESKRNYNKIDYKHRVSYDKSKN